MRAKLFDLLTHKLKTPAVGPNGWEHITSQIGMFSFTGLNRAFSFPSSLSTKRPLMVRMYSGAMQGVDREGPRLPHGQRPDFDGRAERGERRVLCRESRRGGSRYALKEEDTGCDPPFCRDSNG